MIAIDAILRHVGPCLSFHERGNHLSGAKGWRLIAEMSSALAMKVRTGKIDIFQRDAILAQFDHLMVDRFFVLSVDGTHFRTAARFADHYDLGLRGGDALHLAVAADKGLTLVTLDRRLADAGPPLNILTELLG